MKSSHVIHFVRVILCKCFITSSFLQREISRQEMWWFAWIIPPQFQKTDLHVCVDILCKCGGFSCFVAFIAVWIKVHLDRNQKFFIVGFRDHEVTLFIRACLCKSRVSPLGFLVLSSLPIAYHYLKCAYLASILLRYGLCPLWPILVTALLHKYKYGCNTLEESSTSEPVDATVIHVYGSNAINTTAKFLSSSTLSPWPLNLSASHHENGLCDFWLKLPKWVEPFWHKYNAESCLWAERHGECCNKWASKILRF